MGDRILNMLNFGVMHNFPVTNICDALQQEVP